MELVDSEIGLFSISCLYKMGEGGVFLDVFESLWASREESQGNFLGGVGEH